MGPKPIDIKTRFLSNVKKTARCWFWLGHTNGAGYGMIWDNVAKRKILVHRYSYELNTGSIPVGKIVRHTCDVPLCVNPQHLCVGTKLDNAMDVSARDRYGNQISAHGKSVVISNIQARSIRERYASSDASQTVLAREFGVHQATISSIVLGKTHYAAGGPIRPTVRKRACVISDTDWVRLKSRLDNGETQVSLSKEYGVTKAAISVRLWRERINVDRP